MFSSILGLGMSLEKITRKQLKDFFWKGITTNVIFEVFTCIGIYKFADLAEVVYYKGYKDAAVAMALSSVACALSAMYGGVQTYRDCIAYKKGTDSFLERKIQEGADLEKEFNK